MSRHIGHPYDRPRAVWQRYSGRRPTAQYAFWWEHAPIGCMPPGARLAVAFLTPSVVHWGRNGWQMVADTPTVDSGLGFHVAALDTAPLPSGSAVDFTWRTADGAWAGQNLLVLVS